MGSRGRVGPGNVLHFSRNLSGLRADLRSACDFREPPPGDGVRPTLVGESEALRAARRLIERTGQPKGQLERAPAVPVVEPVPAAVADQGQHGGHALAPRRLDEQPMRDNGVPAAVKREGGALEFEVTRDARGLHAAVGPEALHVDAEFAHSGEEETRCGKDCGHFRPRVALDRSPKGQLLVVVAVSDEPLEDERFEEGLPLDVDDEKLAVGEHDRGLVSLERQVERPSPWRQRQGGLEEGLNRWAQSHDGELEPLDGLVQSLYRSVMAHHGPVMRLHRSVMTHHRPVMRLHRSVMALHGTGQEGVGAATAAVSPRSLPPILVWSARALVAAHHELEWVLGGGGGELAHAEVVDDEQRHGRELGEELFAGAADGGAGDVLQEPVSLPVEDPLVLGLDDGAADGLGDVALAGAGWAGKERVLVAQDRLPPQPDVARQKNQLRTLAQEVASLTVEREPAATFEHERESG